MDYGIALKYVEALWSRLLTASRNHLRMPLFTQPVEGPLLPAAPHTQSHLKHHD
jgi:hypothetical protein